MELNDLRREIDGINKQMEALLARRMELTDEVARVKREMDLPTLCPEREKEILDTAAIRAGKWQYEAKAHMELLMSLSRRRQRALGTLFACKRVALIGMPGCGKTVIGQALADYLGCGFTDTDELIAFAEKVSPADIIRFRGVDAFRMMEEKALLTALGKENTVIATGGGIVETPACREELRKSTLCVWIDRPLDDLPAENRPVTQSEGIEALYERRAPLYAETACITVSNTGSVWDAVNEIVDQIAR